MASSEGTNTVETLDSSSASRPAAMAAAEPQLMPLTGEVGAPDMIRV